MMYYTGKIYVLCIQTQMYVIIMVNAQWTVYVMVYCHKIQVNNQYQQKIKYEVVKKKKKKAGK